MVSPQVGGRIGSKMPIGLVVRVTLQGKSPGTLTELGLVEETNANNLEVGELRGVYERLKP